MCTHDSVLVLLFIGIRFWDSDHVITDNLVLEMLAPSTWNGRREVRYTWFGAVDLIGATGVTLEGNHVAGSERAGFWVDGEVSCG